MRSKQRLKRRYLTLSLPVLIDIFSLIAAQPRIRISQHMIFVNIVD